MSSKRNSGFTLIEVTIILLVLVILSGIMLPTIERFIDLARYIRAREDIGALASLVALFQVDTCSSYFRVVGNAPGGGDWNRVDMLVSDGDNPSTDGLTGAQANWNTAFAYWNGAGSVSVDKIANQLALGDPFGTESWGDPYPRPAGPIACGFRGAYIQAPVSADPWGNRYMINVAFLGQCFAGWGRCFGLSETTFKQQDVFVLSAGPDGIVQTPWLVDGVVAQGDDQIAIISGSSM
jgi:type II secretory pathway pseudopilin PulG